MAYKANSTTRASPTSIFTHRVVVARCLISVAVCLAGCGVGNGAERLSAQLSVAEVVDGDTIIVSFGSGIEETVRLLGIDTPETVDPTRPQQCFGLEATIELGRLLPEGTHIRLERDAEARDRFGRMLAYVYRSADDLFINEALVQNGFADVSIYEPNNAYQAELTHAATQAQTALVGLWGACGGAGVALEPDDYQ